MLLSLFKKVELVSNFGRERVNERKGPAADQGQLKWCGEGEMFVCLRMVMVNL